MIYLFLTYRQCLAVQDSWKTLSGNNPEQLGVQFFMRFFLTYPDYRNFYPQFRSDSDDKQLNRGELRQLRDRPELRSLAVSYVDVLGSLFSKLSNLNDLLPLLYSLVDRHYPRGVLHLHFQDVMSSLMVFLEEKTEHSMTSSTREAWRSALQTISMIIDDRYMQTQHKKHIRERV